MLKKYFFFIAGIMLLACPAFAEQFTAVCDTVVDANSLLVTANGKQYTVQLAYIVAPEPKQKFGAEAKKFLETLALNQQLRIDIISTKEHIISAEVFSSKNPDSINRELIRKGLAWPIVENNTLHPYDLSVRLAKKRLLGVWSDPGLKPPSQKSSDDKKTEQSPNKAGAVSEGSQTPPAEAQSGNFLMHQRQNINKANTSKAAQDVDK